MYTHTHTRKTTGERTGYEYVRSKYKDKFWWCCKVRITLPNSADHKISMQEKHFRIRNTLTVISDRNTQQQHCHSIYLYTILLGHIHTCVMRNLVSLSGNLPFSLERIISSMSPCSFSITTNTFSGVSNIHSRFTMPRWRKLWERDQRVGGEMEIVEDLEMRI